MRQSSWRWSPVFLLPLLTAQAFAGIEVQWLGTHSTGVFNAGAAEISAYDPVDHRLFVVNAAASGIDIVDISNPSNPTALGTIDVTPYGHQANSVSFKNGLLAAAVEASPKTNPGKAVFFNSNGQFLKAVNVGALPDMLTFTPDGRQVLVANEGEPSDDYTIDPEGSVSIIDLSAGIAGLNQGRVTTARFNGFSQSCLDSSIRIYGPNATVAQDLEPEYITVSADSKLAWVTLQENNALGILDLRNKRFLALVGLGFKDHSRSGQGLDASDKDNNINVQKWPVRGMYQPDSIATYTLAGIPLLVMANEGDSRAYSGFDEEARVKDLSLDPSAFPTAATLKLDTNLGRLKVTRTRGDTDGDGDYDRLYSMGARSFSIRALDGTLIYDSGDTIEQITADQDPLHFNSAHDDNDSFDSRSDDKGPEPEGLALGKIQGRTYAFVGLERISGFLVFEITNPFCPRFVEFVNHRDFDGDAEAGTAGDLGPEGLLFIPGSQSPNGNPLLISTNEISGTTSVFQVNGTP